MINPKNGEYAPRPIYSRKLARSIFRAAVIEKNGYHNVNRTMAACFKRAKEKEEQE